MDVPEVTGYDVELHEHPLVDGAIGRLRSPMIHHDFDDLHHFFDRHNTYSDWEALLRTRYRARDRSGEIRANPLGTAVERRRFTKRLFLGTPGKPLLYFAYSYLLRGGFLDGRAGFILHVPKSFSGSQIGITHSELRMRSEAAGERSTKVLAARAGQAVEKGRAA